MEKLKIEKFTLESGRIIEDLEIAFTAFGRLNQDHSNIIWVFHALTANSDVREWWSGLFKEGGLYDPQNHFVICANIIGSSYGSTEPQNLDFPEFTVRDIVNSQRELAKALGITRIHTLIGGSLGGSQAMEFAYAYEGQIDNMVLLVCSAKESPWGIAVHEVQRLALQADPTFGTKGAGIDGLKAARAAALLGYRTSDMFIESQKDDESQEGHRASSYINYQGDKFTKRFDSLNYFYLSNCLDTHDLGRDRGGIVVALGEICIPTLVIGIDTDTLVPTRFQREIATHLPNANYHEIQSRFGHDGFLVEVDKISSAISSFYDRWAIQSQNTLLKGLGIFE